MPGVTRYAYGSSEEAPLYKVYVVHGVLNMLLDFAVLVLPTPVILRRAMSRREQFAASALGALGLW